MTVKEERFEHREVRCHVRVEERLRVGSDVFVYIWHADIDDDTRYLISESHGHFTTTAKALEVGKSFAVSAVEMILE